MFLSIKVVGEVDAEERVDLVNEYGIMQAPTLIEIKNGEVCKFVNASAIKGYVEGMRS